MFFSTHRRFHVEINSVEDFLLLCRFIRELDHVDEHVVADLAEKLHKAATTLAAAEGADGQGRSKGA